MARNNDRERSTRRAPKDNGRRTKKKVCIFCKDHLDHVDYKDVNLLRKFMSDRGKIRARRVSGNCAQHQRAVAIAIKTARELALLPYTQRTTSERPGGRGPGRGARPPFGAEGQRPQAAPEGASEIEAPSGEAGIDDEADTDAELVSVADDGGDA
jgi:small subunit ribosomal protein S18